MFKRKSTVKPDLPKEYVWELDYDGVIKYFKCVVTEDMVITYEGDKEHKHLKVMDHECKEGVLQIDTITAIYGEQIPFQLERYIPYIKLESGWKMSDTTREDRMQEAIRLHKRNSRNEVIAGLGFFAAALLKTLITGDLGDWWMANVFGIFCLVCAVYRMVRLRLEINAMKEAEQELDEQTAAAKAEQMALEEPEKEEAAAEE